jgi:hypothetical protein
MDVNELMQLTRDTLTVSRLFGEPYERNGTVVVPVAAVRGGGGGGRARAVDRTVREADPAPAAASVSSRSPPVST